MSFLPALLVLAGFAGAGADRRPLRVEDLFALKEVADPRVSPDGAWVAYAVTTLDPKEDESDTDLWMVPFAGGEAVRLTTSKKGESSPRWSPDGRFLAFLSGREGEKSQVWLLDRRGGEASKLTDFKADVSDLAWSPDSTRLALVVSDPDPDEPAEEEKDAKKKKEKPLVLRRLQFKRDGEGYLRDFRKHLHVFDLAKKEAVQVTSGPYDDAEPAWSPDGKWIAFASNRTAEPDSNDNTDLWAVEPRAGAKPRRLTSGEREDRSPVFSPNGQSIAYLQGPDPADLWYGTNAVCILPFIPEAADCVLRFPLDVSGRPIERTASLDRNAASPRWSADGAAVLFLLEDAGTVHLAGVGARGGPVYRLVGGDREILAFDTARNGATAILETSPRQPAEISAVGPGGLTRLTRTNDAFLAGIRLGALERFRTKSRDGTPIEGFLLRPPDAPAGERLPAILRIHGGPTAQYAAAFEFEWQLLAAHGYAVVGCNPRGSSGYGRDFSRALWADWGNKDFEDVMAAVDHAVASGAADEARLGVGGWSYGGILTNYAITKTDRFKAAITGASEVNYLANYGTDHYQKEWERELGLPWRTTDLWIRLSPWFQVEKIVTPTLVMCGADDMNVPLLNSEQLYQALRRLGRETELVVYPGETHGIERPSFQRDRFERYVAWYDRFLRPRATESAPARPPETTSLLGKPLVSPPPALANARRLEENLAKATAEFVRNPDDADAIVWLGRRTAYLGRFREAVDVYTRGLRLHPNDVHLLRHRGHRWITLREFDRAIEDLQCAATLLEGRPEEIEPDGDPNPTGTPTSTTQFNVWYHLALAHYLKGDFENALAAYRACMRYSVTNDDRLVATSDWLYMTLRRLGREREAAEVLEPIRADLAVTENTSYFHRLLVYKGEKSVDELLASSEDAGTNFATLLYGAGNWFLCRGDRARAREVFERIVAGPQWPAFGHIAAEAELARMR